MQMTRRLLLQLLRPRFKKSFGVQISSKLGYFKKKNAFLVYAIWFHEPARDKKCSDKKVKKTKNSLERCFVK